MKNKRGIKSGIFAVICVFFALHAGCKKSVTIPTELPDFTTTPTAATPTSTITPVVMASDVYEPDNSPAPAAVITPGIQARNIWPKSDVDWILFTVGAPGADVVLETSGPPGGDTVMYLYGAFDTVNPVASNNDKNPGTNSYSKITMSLPAGNYYAEITSLNYSSTTAYDLSLSMVNFTPTLTQTLTHTASPTVTMTGTATLSPTITPTPTITQVWQLLGGVAPPLNAWNGEEFYSFFESSGTLFLAYRDGLTLRARVVSHNGGNWNPVGSLDFSPQYVENMGLFVYNGLPYVAFQVSGAGNNYPISVMRFDGASWVNVGAMTYLASGKPEICVDNGDVYIAYMYYDTVVYKSYLYVSKFDGVNWIPLGTTGFQTGGQFRLIVKNGTVYLGYTDQAYDSRVNVMVYNGAGWSFLGGAGFTPDTVASFDMWLDNTVPYVVFARNNSVYTISVMKFNGSAWEIVGNDNFTNSSGSHPSIFVYNGAPYVSFIDSYYGSKMTVMKFNGVFWEAAGARGFSPVPAGYYNDLFIYNGTAYAWVAESTVMYSVLY